MYITFSLANYIMKNLVGFWPALQKNKNKSLRGRIGCTIILVHATCFSQYFPKRGGSSQIHIQIHTLGFLPSVLFCSLPVTRTRWNDKLIICSQRSMRRA
jgi:hypothetical protein